MILWRIKAPTGTVFGERPHRRVSAVHSTKFCPNGAEEFVLAKATLHDAYRLSVMLVCTKHRVRACNGRHGHIHSARNRMPPFVVLGAHVGGGAFWICMRTRGEFQSKELAWPCAVRFVSV